MSKRIVIVDDFYPDPFRVRDIATSATYRELDDFVGWRTEPCFPRGIRTRLERTLGITVTEFPGGQEAYRLGNGVFFTSFAGGRYEEPRFVHTDEPRSWGTVVVYLTPEAPMGTGTSFWQHRRTSLTHWPTYHDARRLGIPLVELQRTIIRDQARLERWVEIDRVGNVFNRALFFPGGRFHAGLRHFGATLRDGRIFQRFRFPSK